jgi:hypothetical protein
MSRPTRWIADSTLLHDSDRNDPCGGDGDNDADHHLRNRPAQLDQYRDRRQADEQCDANSRIDERCLVALEAGAEEALARRRIVDPVRRRVLDQPRAQLRRDA